MKKLDRALKVLSWLVDMCAPDPAAILGTSNPPADRASWLLRTAPRPWVPIYTGVNSHEVYAMETAGLLELEHRGPSVLKITSSKVIATCYPSIQLTDLGARFCRLTLLGEHPPDDPDYFGAMLAQVLECPDAVALFREYLNSFGDDVMPVLRAMKDSTWLLSDKSSRDSLIDWAAMVLASKKMTASETSSLTPTRVAELLSGVPT